MDKFEGKLDSLIHKEVRRRIRKCVKHLDRTESENARLSAKLYEQEEEIIALEKELKTAKKLSLQSLTGGYKLGDKVWIVRSEAEQKNCEKCNGSKKVNAIIDGVHEEIKCPSCTFGYQTSWILTPKEDQIEFITITIERQKTFARYWLERIDRYLDENEVFKTKEECQKYCDEINAKNQE
ncbi:hypothetical protein [Brevibacillus laterosporus]|uniref:Uncharacterized protein n=1 Tax=Brevibacillus laterosporus TaxID=1465 RepID=A0AAP3DHI8_BRELA|nr:hypothetical protein [Brevibacillus laterosporus]MCR8980917.1 hypothetical protein [Brevibacillus laterosporus]MCZ0808072.1 hypothetical protein [Brevibacillus laterosporus]MCZ0826264.1 hypothetical protein [Brevibacillus laterosporus]MCZ0850147.1 hypothetical protein [Brevibacillus laterosporus]